MAVTQGRSGSQHTKEAWYQRYPDLDARMVDHVTGWRDSVPVGTIVTVSDMLNYKDPGRHGIPIEVIGDFLSPKYGKCPVEGVRPLRTQLSPEEEAAGYVPVMLVKRVHVS